MSVFTYEQAQLPKRCVAARRDGECIVGRQGGCRADVLDGREHELRAVLPTREGDPWEGLRYEQLVRLPERFALLVGVSVATFDGIFATVMPHYVEEERRRLNTAVRLRAHGGGRPAKLTPHDRLLMAVVWLRHHPTHEALAALFQIDHSNVTRLLARVVPLLERTRQDTMRQADPGKNNRPNLAALQSLLCD
jgi:hypothetical protein